MSPKILIQLAFKLDEWKISGGPKWLDSDRYDVAATLPAGASQEQIPAMLQACWLIDSDWKLAGKHGSSPFTH